MSEVLIIFHIAPSPGRSGTNYLDSYASICDQLETNFQLLILGEMDSESETYLEKNKKDFLNVVPEEGYDFVRLNRCIEAFDGQYLLYVDARQNPVILKKACLTTFAMAAERQAGASMFYSDYELDNGKEISEVKLLFHHLGRVRDNQDYGSVFFIRKDTFIKTGLFDESLRYNQMYDIRLKLSERGELIRIANKYKGSLYRVRARERTSNVFDYLLSGREVQIEAEAVVTAHLKRIGAYLSPGVYMNRPNLGKQNPSLDASVIIPVGHRPEFIATAIDSIQAQSHGNIEAIIVVNGGENDPTAEVVRKYMAGGSLYDPQKPEIRLIVIDVNNIGLCLNIGTRNARGKYYVQLDSDDRLKPDAIEKILNVFMSDPEIGMVIGSYEVWEKKADGKLYRMDEIPVVTHDEWTPDNGRNNLLRINGAGAPRSIPIELIRAMGYFSINDDAYARNYGEDYEMVNMIAEHYKIGRVYDPIYEVVRHSGGTDHSISQELVDRNDEAKDDMRKKAILRRIAFNKG